MGCAMGHVTHLISSQWGTGEGQSTSQQSQTLWDL